MNAHEEYKLADKWQDKVLIMNIFHLTQCQKENSWTLKKTAIIFEVSIGLVSENLRLASAIDTGTNIFTCATRQEALTKLERRKHWQS